jgi:hypothetical protein
VALMLDLRGAREVVRRLDEALQRLADDTGVPAEVIALVSEIETALVDTGPLEIGVSAAGFVGALETSRRIRVSLGAADAVTQHGQIVRFLRELRRLFRRLPRLLERETTTTRITTYQSTTKSCGRSRSFGY